MATNYASKYSQLVDERFIERTMTDQAVNKDYDFDGVNTVYIYDVNTVAMNNYTASGSNRYGTPSELGTGTQTAVLSQDRSFTYTVDRKNYTDQQMVTEVGRSLARQIDLVVAPEVDQYRFAKMIVSSGYLDGTAITTSNAYSKFLDARANIRNNKVPANGLMCFCNTDFYKKIKQDSAFIKSSEIAQTMLITGQVGKIDNIPIIEVPDEYLLGCEFIITHPIATSAMQKIYDFKTHDNPPGINGWLVEGRIFYDAFVRTYKKGAIATQVAGFTTVSTAGAVGKTVLTAKEFSLDTPYRAGLVIKYATGAAQAATTVGTDISSWTTYTTGSAVSATATHKITLALADSDGKAVVPGTSVTVAIGTE